MTVVATPAPDRGETTLELYRDDGPLAQALGNALGRYVPLPPIALVVAGALPMFAALAIDGARASDGLAGLCIGWLILIGGISSGRPNADRLRWAVAPVLRVAEYGAVLWLGALAGGSAPASAFALLCVIAFRHYELVYRLRYHGVPPPPWVGNAGGGWDLRLLLGFLLMAASLLPAGFYAMAGLLAVLFVGESVAYWTRAQRTEQIVQYEDEEAEGE
jgi:Family of unknown function (DUF5941)